jgi:hypothetical protein
VTCRCMLVVVVICRRKWELEGVVTCRHMVVAYVVWLVACMGEMEVVVICRCR